MDMATDSIVSGVLLASLNICTPTGAKTFAPSTLNTSGCNSDSPDYLRRQPSDGGLVERPFKTLNTQLFSTLPGYTGSHVQERPKEAEKEATLMLTDLERLVVRYVVDNYILGIVTGLALK